MRSGPWPPPPRRRRERDAITATQHELRRNGGPSRTAFQTALREKVQQELAPRPEPKRKLAIADWQSLSLVEDGEVEERMNFERIGQMISHECEWQLRELAAYMGALTGIGRADEERNPLRSDVIGTALYRGIEAVTDEHRQPQAARARARARRWRKRCPSATTTS